MSYKNGSTDGCDCDVFSSQKSRIRKERVRILDITIVKSMEKQNLKFDKAILCRSTVVNNTMNRLQEEIRKEGTTHSDFDNDLDRSWEFEEFQNNLNAFEANIERMMQSGTYEKVKNTDQSCKRTVDDLKIEDMLSEFRLPRLLSPIPDDPKPKRGKNSTTKSHKRNLDDLEIEAILSDYRLPHLLSPIRDVPVAKRLKNTTKV